MSSKPFINSLGRVDAALPITVTKFVELYNPAAAKQVSAAPNDVREQLTVHGVIPSALKLGNSREFIFTNRCVLPADALQAEALRFETPYAMPHTFLIKSLSSEFEQINLMVQQLNDFFEGSRPSLYFHVQQIFQ